MGYSTYSLADTYTTISNPDVGKMVLSDNGAGRIGWQYSGDISSHTNTATGHTVINKLVATNGSISLEVPVNSEADRFLSKLIKYLKKQSTPTNRFALTTLTVKDNASGVTYSFSGVTPRKVPAENRDQTASNKSYDLLFAELVEA